MKAWWQRRTLRSRLALWYAAVGTLLVAGFSATLYVFVATRLAQPLDYELRRDLVEVQGKLEVGSNRALTWDDRAIHEQSAWMTENPWFELWDENSQLVRRFWPFNETRIQQAPSAPTRGRETISVFSVAPDLRLRVLSVPYARSAGEPEWMMRVMRLHEPTGDALAALRWIIVIALPVVIALLVLGGYGLTRRWLTPLDRMAAEANTITADDLSRRLSVANPHDELGRLTAVFNVTLDRLEGAFVALDRFVADASHELRTPLTTLRNVGEIGLRRSRTVDEYREIIGSMLEEAQRLQSLVQRLLELASASGGAAEVHRTEIRLDTSVTAWVGELSILAESKNQKITVDAVACTVSTDAVIFRQALQNLVDNATKYSPEHTTIRVVIRDRAQQVSVEVRDEGPGISPENQSQLTERFFRPDRGRGRNRGGFGLGLAITKAYMRVLGGSLEYEPGQSRGSVFRLILPKG